MAESYCPLCAASLQLRDHHCKALGVCVHQGNRIDFMLLTLSGSVGLSLLIATLIFGLHWPHDKRSLAPWNYTRDSSAGTELLGLRVALLANLWLALLLNFFFLQQLDVLCFTSGSCPYNLRDPSQGPLLTHKDASGLSNEFWSHLQGTRPLPELEQLALSFGVVLCCAHLLTLLLTGCLHTVLLCRLVVKPLLIAIS